MEWAWQASVQDAKERMNMNFDLFGARTIWIVRTVVLKAQGRTVQ